MQALGVTLFALCLIFLVARIYLDLRREDRVERMQRQLMEARNAADLEDQKRARAKRESTDIKGVDTGRNKS